MTDPATIARVLSEAQKKALLAFTPDHHYPGDYAKASELRVSGGTLSSMNGFGGVHPETLEIGPILVTPDRVREGTFWQITPLGLAVRAYLESIHETE